MIILLFAIIYEIFSRQHQSETDLQIKLNKQFIVEKNCWVFVNYMII